MNKDLNLEDQQSLSEAKKKRKEYRKRLQQLKKKKLKQVNTDFNNLHDKEFETMDCLTCANCCKTTSPIFRNADINRLAKHLKIKAGKFTESHLKLDDDQDYVLKSSPCTFLNSDNTCQVYEYRPLACREYPHTDRKNVIQIMNLTLENTEICPAVARIVDKITQA
ncbi:MAG: YkgJ family cysteine cluster protein [Crocinitomicaceae bacterium]|nr:YkgJ family cysteine cluster protein [Crocinitomicaceae bacterium]MDG1735425.1 YkgJ family cysteine cluster protein [Crocinitomicaceae bacterium]MDG2506067.1 YkgJ family cysteine cluster protein [Crocinitomicaceae bacterium]